RAGDEDLPRGDRGDVGQARVRLVLVGEFGLVEGDGPVDGGGLVGEVEEGVFGVRRPVVVDEVRVCRVRLERLVRVADAAGHEDRARGVELGGEDRAVGGSFAQVDPGAEDAAGGEGDELVPGLGVD